MIHKALRAMLYDTALTLQQTYFGREDETRLARNKVERVIRQFEQHAYHEDAYILPAIAAFEPELVDAFEKEHAEDLKLGNKLKHLINIFGAAITEEERVIAGSAISRAYIEFLTFNLTHMAKEEAVLNAVLWKCYTDEQLQQINAEIVASIPDAEKAVSVRWMVRGINNNEAISWLKAIKQTAPEHLFQSVIALAGAELPSDRFAAIKEAVMAETELVY